MKANDMLDIVSKVLPGTSTKGLVEGMNSLIFRNGSVCSFNDKISINYLLPDSIEINGSVVANDFYKIIKSIKGNKEVTITTSENSMIISSDDTEAELSLNNSEGIKDKIKSLDIEEIEFYELPKDFVRGLSLCRRSASDNVSEQSLFCVSCFDSFIVSTDKYRISEYKLEDDLKFPFLLPKTVSKEVVDFNPEQYCVREGWVHFLNSNDAIMSCRVVQGDIEKFGEFQKVFNSYKNSSSITLPQELKDTLDEIISFSDELLAVQKNVHIIIKGDELFCKIKKENGWLKKKLTIKSKIEVEFFISGVFLQDIMNTSTGLHISEDKQRALLEHKNYRHMIVLPK